MKNKYTVVLKFPDYLEDMADHGVFEAECHTVDEAIETARSHFTNLYDVVTSDDFFVVVVFIGEMVGGAMHDEAIGFNK